MDLVVAAIVALWVALPTYIPNNVAVIAGGGTPIDGGQRWRGARILGDGKTWRGTAAGITGGVIVALLLNWINGTASSMIGVDFPAFPMRIVLAFPIGALLGDIVASFIKRRTGRSRGSAFPLVDQLDFLVVALLLGAIVDFGWMADVFTPAVIAAVVVLTPILHIGTNVIGYALGFKQEPW